MIGGQIPLLAKGRNKYKSQETRLKESEAK